LSYGSVLYSLQNGYTFEEAIDITTKRNVEYNGVVYKNMKKACKKLGVDDEQSYQRLLSYTGSGYSFQDAFDKVKLGKKTGINVEYNGKQYESVTEACKDLNVDYNFIMRHIDSDKETFESAVDAYRSYKSTNISVTYDGIEYDSLNSACDALGLKYNKIKSKMYRDGITFSEAIDWYKETKVEQKEQKKVEYNGVFYNNYSEVCKNMGFNICYLIGYMSKNDCDINTAINILADKVRNNELSQKDYYVVYKDKEYNGLLTLCNDLGIARESIKYRCSLGMSLEDAIKYSKISKDRHKVVYNNVEYDSVSELCRSLNIGVQYVRKCIRDGMNLEEAIIGSRLLRVRRTFNILNKYKLDEGIYYECECKNCTVKDLLTVDEMEEHKCYDRV
jgi:hypothetical protein